jgi:hypothetical protein
MKELLDKLSAYNLFNYLLPGTLFVAVAQRITSHTFHHDNIVVQLFAYYFIGLVISRIGSLTVEPALRAIGFVKFAPYQDFVRVSKLDPKVELLSEQNNMFRTLAALFVALLGYKIADATVLHFGIPRIVSWTVGLIALFILFLFAYQKQTRYIRQRIEAAPKK